MQTFEILLSLSVALLAGLMLSRLAKLAKLPAVTAYLVAGVLVGPFVIGRLGIPGVGFGSLDDVEAFSIVSDVALGFIAFSIGNEFRLSQLKKIGKQATVIGIMQAIVTTFVVDVFLILLSFILPEGVLPLPAAIVLGAVATATAPAATLMVVRQYKAKGPLTDILLPVVALDDAVGLVVFAISFGIAKALNSGKPDFFAIIVDPILEVILSLALGAIIGFLFHFSEKLFHSNSKRIAMSVAFVVLAVAISSIDNIPPLGPITVRFSPLLVCMMLGTVFCNICDLSEELMGRADRWATPILALFFVLSGAELDFAVFGNLSVILIGVVYIIARSIGKYTGACGSAALMKCNKNIVKYLGITLLPQAGVALGMAQQAKALNTDGSDIGTLVSNITLFAVLIYELVGPLLTKICLTKAGDIKPEGKRSVREEAKRAAEGK